MTRLNPFRLSIELDPEILESLGYAQRACLLLIGVIAGVVLAAWFTPSLARVLPSSWSVMQSNTALVALASALSLALSTPKQTERVFAISQILSVGVGLLTAGTLVEYLFHVSLHIDRFLPERFYTVATGRMAPQTADCFLCLACVLFFVRKRKQAAAIFADVAVCVLCAAVLLNGAGYLYHAIRLFGLSEATRTAPTTLVCLALLSFVAFGRRAEVGVYGILLGRGIGSRISRIAFPIALLVPFGLEAVRLLFVKDRLMAPEYAAAVVTALEVPLAFSVILLLAWHIDSLEREIRELSLRDELTQLYNRRGLYLFAEQSLRLAHRAHTSFSVLFLDLDGLKHINDTQGHETGSLFIQEVAQVLQQEVRDADVVGRIGGDEFVIAGAMSEAMIAETAARLERISEEKDAQAGRPYRFCFSLGFATTHEGTPETLDDLLHRADAAMYERKRARRLEYA